MGASIVSIFLLFGPSAFLWENIPFFNYIQFPGRWLNITSFTVVFLSAMLFYAPERFKEGKTYHFSVIAILFFICLLFDYSRISLAPVFTKQELIPVRAVNWTREHLPIGINFDSLYKNKDLKEKVEIIRGEGKTEVVKWESAERTIKITAYEPITLKIRTFYFPGWKAYIGEKQTEIKTEKDTGAMLIDLTIGEHMLLLKLEDTPLRFFSKLISLISIAGFAVLQIFLKVRRKSPKSGTIRKHGIV